MANTNETTAKFKVDISDLKKNIQEANRQIKLANAEFKAASSGMKDWEKSTDGLSTKIGSLKNVLSNQEKILKSYEKQLELITAEYGDSSKEADNMRIKIANQQTAVNKTKNELTGYESKLEEVVKAQSQSANVTEEQNKAYNELKKTINDQQSELAELKNTYANVVIEQGKNSEEAKNLSKQISDLSGELSENKTKLKDAESAASEFDKSLENLDDEANNTTNGGLSVFTVALGNLAADILSNVINKMKDTIANTIEVGKAFEKSMSNVQAISGATDEELAMLRDTAKEFGSSTQFSASEAADALGYMALAGWDAETSASALGGVLNLAASSGMDLAKASDMVTDYMSAFGIEASKSAYFADVMAYAQGNANTTVEGLGEAFKNSAANMNAAGQDVETTTALLAMMANQGLKGSEAGTALTAVMRDMTAKMKDGAIQIGETSIAVQDSEGNYRDLTDILLDVEKATYGMGDAEKSTALMSTFTSDSIKGLNLILNAGVGEASKFEDELRSSTGTAETMADVMNDNLNGDLTALNSKLEGVQIAMYEKFEPALRAGVDVLDSLLNAIQFVVDHSTEFIAALTAMGAGIAAYVAYTTALKIMTEGWKSLTIVTKLQAAAQAALNAVMALNPIGLIIAGIVALVAAFVILWNKSEAFRNFWIGLWEGLKNSVLAVVDWIKENWQSMLLFLINPLAGIFKYCYEHFEGFRNFVDGVVQSIKDFFVNMWDGLKEIFGTIADWINVNVFQPIIAFFEPVITFFTEAWNIIKQLAEGCWIAIKAIWSVVSEWINTNVIQPVKKFFSDLWDKVSSAASTAWNKIKGVWNVVSSWFNNTIIQPVSKFFGNMWDKLKSGASQAWDGIKSVFGKVADWFKEKFSAAWQNVKDVFSTGGKIFDGIKDGIVNAFKTVVNGIIRAINKIIAVPFNAINKILDKIKGVSIAGIKPFEKLISRFTVPEIPELAKGGVLKKGQVGLLEGDGAEAVVPLENNKKWIRATANALKVSLQEEGLLGGLSNNASTVNNNYSFVQNNNSPKALSRLDIYRQTRNQLQFAKGV